MKKVYILAAVVAVVVAIAVFMFASSVKDENRIDTEIAQETIVAVGDIKKGTIITSEMLVKKGVPNAAVLPGAYTTTEKIVGMIAASDIYAQEQIIPNKLISKEDQSKTQLSYNVKEGYRAITVAVSDTSGVSGFIRSGDFVDILYANILFDGKNDVGLIDPNEPIIPQIEALNEERDNENPDAKTTDLGFKLKEVAMYMEKCEVLAVGTYQDNSTAAEGGVLSYSTVTLMLTAEDAAKLSALQQNVDGGMTLLLRNPEDDSTNPDVSYKYFVVEK